MAEIQLTQAQQAAVDNRGGSLLVSAAAGSGKTKVLVERLFAYMERERCDVDDFLIITYTKAAAAELRGKIAAELSRRVAVHPESGHLRRQLITPSLSRRYARAYAAHFELWISACLRRQAVFARIPCKGTLTEALSGEALRQGAVELS